MFSALEGTLKNFNFEHTLYIFLNNRSSHEQSIRSKNPAYLIDGLNTRAIGYGSVSDTFTALCRNIGFALFRLPQDNYRHIIIEQARGNDVKSYLAICHLKWVIWQKIGVGNEVIVDIRECIIHQQ